MCLFPHIAVTIDSPLTPEEVRRLIKSRMHSPAFLHGSDAGTVYLTGTVSHEEFYVHIMRSKMKMAGQSPQIHGRIVPFGSGSRISIRIAPDPLIGLMLGAVTAGILIYALICIFGTKQYDSAVGPLLVLLYMLVVFPFMRRSARRDNQKALDYICALLK